MEHHHQKPRAPSWHILAMLALLLALVIACVVGLALVRDTLDPAASSARQAAHWRQAQIEAHLSDLDFVVAGAWRLLPLVLISASAFVALAITWRCGWAPTLQADKVIELQRATTQQYSPALQSLTLSYHNAPRLTTASRSEAAAERQMLAEGVPAFGELLARGRVGKGNPLLLGFDVESGGELHGSWLDLYSTAVSGMPGSGKTTSQRFLACQTALHGARFAICDPHAGAAEDSLAATLAPLAAAFVCEPASSDKAILEVVRYVADVGRRRVAGKDQDITSLILWVDELTSLLARSSVAEALAELLEQVAQEYRKRFVFVCASGQIWTAARTTSELRDSFASVLCHRMKRAQARLLLPAVEAEQVERLQTGRAVLWRTSGDTRVVQIPNTTAQDCQRVAGLLKGGWPTSATAWLPDQPHRSQIEAELQPPEMPGGSQEGAESERLPRASVSAEAARAAQMFLDGIEPAAIVWELRKVKSNQGGKYQAALAEVLHLIRVGVRR